MIPKLLKNSVFAFGNDSKTIPYTMNQLSFFYHQPLRFSASFKKHLLFCLLSFSVFSFVNAQAQQQTTNFTATSLNFDGTDDYVNLGNALGNFGRNNFTVEMYLKTTVGSQFVMAKRPVCNHASFWNISIADNKLVFEVDNDESGGNYAAITSPADINDNKWHHIALVRSDVTVIMYIDGANVGSMSTPNVINLNNAADLYIGANGACPGRPTFSGVIDEVRIWGIARTAEQLNAYKGCELRPTSAGLIAYYPCNQLAASNGKVAEVYKQTAGTLLDMSRHGYNGKLMNFALTGATSNWVSESGLQTDKNVATALSFDGVNDIIDFGTTFGNFGTSDFTVEMTFKTAIPSQFLIAKRVSCGVSNFWNLSMADGKLVFELCEPTKNNSIISPVASNDNKWHHVAMVRQGAKVSMYLDGMLAGTCVATNAFSVSNTAKLFIGTNGACGGRSNFNGSIDEIRFWNVARSQAEIQGYMTSELPSSKMEGLTNYFPINQGVGDGINTNTTVLLDVVGTNNGTLTNFALTGTSSNWVKAGAVKPYQAPAYLNFDGVDDVVEVNTTLGNFGTNNFTIEAQVKCTASGYQPIITKRNVCNHDNFWNLNLIDGKFVFELDQDASGGNYAALTSINTYNDGGWHHVAVTREGKTVVMYVDGMAVADASTPNIINSTNAATLYFGDNPVCDVPNFKGSLDEIRFWKGARSQQQIQFYRGTQLPPNTNIVGLLAYYNFNQGNNDGFNPDVQTLTDASGNNQTAKLRNFGLISETSNWVRNRNLVMADGTGSAASALKFDGKDDFISFDASMGNFGTNDFTIELLFQTTDISLQSLMSKREVCGNSSFWDINIIGGRVSFELDNDATGANYSALTTDVQYNDGLWHHLAVVRAGKTVTMYIDGLLVRTNTTAAVVNVNNNAPFLLGKLACCEGITTFEGAIDEFRIWSEARNVAALRSNMSSEVLPTVSNLAAYYNFNQGASNTDNSQLKQLIETTGKGKIGTLTNFDLKGKASNWVATNVTPVVVKGKTIYATAENIAVKIDNTIMNMTFDKALGYTVAFTVDVAQNMTWNDVGNGFLTLGQIQLVGFNTYLTPMAINVAQGTSIGAAVPGTVSAVKDLISGNFISAGNNIEAAAIAASLQSPIGAAVPGTLDAIGDFARNDFAGAGVNLGQATLASVLCTRYIGTAADMFGGLPDEEQDRIKKMCIANGLTNYNSAVTHLTPVAKSGANITMNVVNGVTGWGTKGVDGVVDASYWVKDNIVSGASTVINKVIDVTELKKIADLEAAQRNAAAAAEFAKRQKEEMERLAKKTGGVLKSGAKTVIKGVSSLF